MVSTKLKKGQHIAKRKGYTIVENWQDKREMLMLTTYHSGKMVESNWQTKEVEKKKPESIISYNNFMCCVDRMDQPMSYCSPRQKTLKMVPQSCVAAP